MTLDPRVYATAPIPEPAYRHDIPRKGAAWGGPADGGQGRDYAVDPYRRDPGMLHDALISRDRMPFYRMARMRTVAQARVSWTESGPVRVNVAMRNNTLRRMQGSDATRFFDPHPIASYGTQDQGHGMHTNPLQPKYMANRRYTSGNPQMTVARVNRLSPAVYTGQSYSQTTTIQGSAGPEAGR